jgi:glycerol uptake facilitator protein
MQVQLARRLGAELIGTALLVMFGAGSFVADLTVTKGRLTYAGIGFIALSFALIIAAIIYAFGNLSGGHFNPAVTLALAITRRFPAREVGPYILVQIAGAVLGGLCIIGTFGHGAANIHVTGGTTLGKHVDYAQGVLAEGLGTYFVMLTVMALAIDRRAPTGWAGLIIGLAVAGEILVIGPLTSGSVNPARTTGPYLMSEIFGHAPPWRQYFIYWVGPFAGALAAALSYDLVMRPRAADEKQVEPGEGGGEVEGRVP